MAVTPTPIFSQAIRHNVEAISTANTNRDGSGTLGASPFTAGSNGSILDYIEAIAIGTTTAGVVRLFIHNGTASFLWRELLVTAITPSVSIAVWSALVDCRQRFLPSGWSLRASTHIAESFNIHCFGSNL